MPGHVVDKVVRALNEDSKPLRGSRIVLAGVAYKPDVHDTREAPARHVFAALAEQGAFVSYCDPWVPVFEVNDSAHVSSPWSRETLSASDCAVLVTAHTEFLREPLWEHAPLVIDTRNVVPAAANVRKL